MLLKLFQNPIWQLFRLTYEILRTNQISSIDTLILEVTLSQFKIQTILKFHSTKIAENRSIQYLSVTYIGPNVQNTIDYTN